MTLKSFIYRKSCGFTNYSWGSAHALRLFSRVHPEVTDFRAPSLGGKGWSLIGTCTCTCTCTCALHIHVSTCATPLSACARSVHTCDQWMALLCLWMRQTVTSIHVHKGLLKCTFKGTVSSRSEQTFNRAWNRCPTLRWTQWLKLTDSFTCTCMQQSCGVLFLINELTLTTPNTLKSSKGHFWGKISALLGTGTFTSSKLLPGKKYRP